MKYRLSLRRAAVEDMSQAEAYYASEEEGLDVRFRNEIAQSLRRIEDNPKLYPVSEKSPYRKATVSVFPFCIYYCIAGSKVVVIAIHDARRNPRIWQQRTSS